MRSLYQCRAFLGHLGAVFHASVRAKTTAAAGNASRPRYKLTYLNVTARGEVSRTLFAVAGVEFEDCRIDWDKWNEWPHKDKLPFGKVPILEVDDQILCQSHAIERYLAREFGLAGKTSLDMARCDMIIDGLDDLLDLHVPIVKEHDKTKKLALVKKFIAATDTAMDNFTKILEANNGGNGFFVGDEMTYADIAFYHCPNVVEYFIRQPIDWSRWPKLKALRERVESNEGVARWLKQRPKTLF